MRSEKYKQGSGALRDANDQFCCLGVLADVCHVRWKRASASKADVYQCGLKRGDLWIGKLPGQHPLFGLSAVQIEALVGLNDERHWNFRSIAKWVEKHV